MLCWFGRSWTTGSLKRDAVAFERIHRAINARISCFVRSWEGVVVRHRQLEGNNRCFMRLDGVHLNYIGLDIFFLDYRMVLSRHCSCWVGVGSPCRGTRSPPWR